MTLVGINSEVGIFVWICCMVIFLNFIFQIIHITWCYISSRFKYIFYGDNCRFACNFQKKNKEMSYKYSVFFPPIVPFCKILYNVETRIFTQIHATYCIQFSNLLVFTCVCVYVCILILSFLSQSLYSLLSFNFVILL